MAVTMNTAPTRAAAPAQVGAPTRDDLAKLLLRVTLGALLLLHGIAKLQNGIDPIIDAVANAGLPPVLAYGVFVGEVVAPLLLIAGMWSRVAAGVIVINMVTAIALMHGKDLGTLSRSGGWALELQAFYLVVALAVALLGAGRFGLGNASSRLN